MGTGNKSIQLGDRDRGGNMPSPCSFQPLAFPSCLFRDTAMPVVHALEMGRRAEHVVDDFESEIASEC